MKSNILCHLLGVSGIFSVLLLAGTPSSPAADVIISEFMARNDRTLADEEGAFPDWIELHNAGTITVNLDGWYLTERPDNLAQWRIPNVSLAPNGYLVIFASGKDRTNPPAPLHTNFQLDGDGEFLALVQPDGTNIASAYAPAFPPQYDDISYGTGQSVTRTNLVATGAPVKWQIPADGSLGTNWTYLAFDDSGWSNGRTGLGYSGSSDPAAAALYAYWPVREGAGTVASNLVSGGTHATLFGGAAWFNDPVRGTVLSFNGTSAYASAGTIPRMGQTTSNFTWSFWYKQNAVVSVNSTLLGNRSGGVQSPLQFIKFTPSNFEYYRGANIGFIPYTIPTGQWLHLAVVKNGSSLTYYANGVRVGSSTAGGDIEANPFYWGGDPGAAGEWANGLFDDVALWTTALTTNQVQMLAAGASPLAVGGYAAVTATDVRSSMQNVNASAYVRIPFTVPEGTPPSTLKLRMKYDDGFVAYLNGMEVARRNAPANPQWNSAATVKRAEADALAFEEIDLTGFLDALEFGPNVLALQGLNSSAGDANFLILPELEAATITDAGPRYFGIPTPGAINNLGVAGYVADTKFSHDRGFYDTNFFVTVTCATPGATIRYTTNGTAPTETTGIVYTGPIPITNTTVLRAAAFKAGWQSSDADAQSYIFLDAVLKQTGAGLPTFAWAGGRTPDYAMDQRVVTNAEYAARIKDDMKSLPVVSIAVDVNEFWGANGIYTKSDSQGVAWERACSAEMFFPDNSRNGFQINCGIRAAGGASRSGLTPKHGLRLLFKGIYGPTKLNYKFFENSEVDRFDTIQFRPNFNMSWVRTDNSGPLNNGNADGAERTHAIYVRDQFTKDSQRAMGSMSAHERFVHLYINGVYWGVYNPGERTDASFDATYFGGEKEQYDAIFSDLSSVSRAVDGDKNAWNTALSIAGGGLSNATQYATIQRYLDVTNLADYMMLNFYCSTVDWPWQNWNAGRKRETNAQFKIFVWDAEYTLETPPWVPEDRTGVGGASNEGDSPARFYFHLRQNPEWRLLFADRAQKHFFNNGALTTNQTIPRFLGLCDIIDRAIVCESARWGDVVRTTQPYTRNVEWLTEKNRLLTQFFSNRTALVIQQFKNAGLYPSNSAPRIIPWGGVLSPTAVVALSATNGTVYFTINGDDPRVAWTGAVSPSAQSYSGLITLTNSCRLKARVLAGTNWSALEEAVFLRPDIPPLRITEIMYRPDSAGNGTNTEETLEFIELRNIGATPLAIGGYHFDRGITFTFPASTVLGGGDFVLVVANRAAFESRYGPGLNVAGEYVGQLQDNGEEIRLLGALDEVIQDFDYSNWYPLTDGLGYSLVVVNDQAALEAWKEKEGWRASSQPGGSPGAPDPVPSVPPVYINEILTRTLPPAQDAIELYNPNTGPVDLGGWFLSDDRRLPRKYRIPDGTMITGHSYHLFTEVAFNQPPNGFALNSDGDEVYLFSANASGNLTGWGHGFAFGAAALNTTLGRYVTGNGEERFAAEIRNTLGTNNAGPQIGPVVINEVHYHAPDPSDEFLELKNVLSQPVMLYDRATGKSWRLAGLDFEFPSEFTVPGQGLVVLVNTTNLDSFRARYNVPAIVPVFHYPGGLQNNGENLELQRPGNPLVGEPGYLPADVVRYNDRIPWPAAADGTGASLQKPRADLFGDDPTHWIAAVPSPGRENGSGLPPVITVQPQSQTSLAYQNVSFTVGVSPASSLTYQWAHNGANLPGATNATLVLPSADPSQAGLYTVAVSNPNGSVLSDPAGLVLQIPPIISQQPQNVSVTVRAGATTNASFSVATSGTGPIRYQWRFQGQDISDATNATLLLTNVQTSHHGTYDVRIADDVGAVLSAPAVLTPLVTISVIQSPQSVTNMAGATVTASIGISGYPPPFGYQLRKGSTSLTNQWLVVSNCTFTFENIQFAQGGSYRIVVTNLASPSGQAGNFTITVLSAPIITTQPTNQSVNLGSNAMLAVIATGTTPLAYQWYFQETNALTQATNASLTVTNSQAANQGNYTVVVTNIYGAVTSDVAAVLFRAPPTLAQEPADRAVYVGSNAAFSVVAAGGGPYGYRWMFNETIRVGPNAATLIITNTALSNGGPYRVVVTNAMGAVTSAVATLTVLPVDADGDGLFDGWELAHGLNPHDPADRDQDADGDGMTNAQEYFAGTDPQNAQSLLRVTVQDSAEGAELQFPAMPGVEYTVQYRTHLDGAGWLNLMTFPAEPGARVITLRDPAARWYPSRYYRLVTSPRP